MCVCMWVFICIVCEHMFLYSWKHMCFLLLSFKAEPCCCNWAQSDASGTGGDGRWSSEGRAGSLLLSEAERSPGGEAWQVLPGLLASLRSTFLRCLFHQEFLSQVGWGPVTFSLVFKSQACRLFILWRSRWGQHWVMDVHVGGWDPLWPDGSTGHGFRYLVHFSGSSIMFYSPCPDNLTPQELQGNMLLSSCEK